MNRHQQLCRLPPQRLWACQWVVRPTTGTARVSFPRQWESSRRAHVWLLRLLSLGRVILVNCHLHLAALVLLPADRVPARTHPRQRQRRIINNHCYLTPLILQFHLPFPRRPLNSRLAFLPKHPDPRAQPMQLLFVPAYELFAPYTDRLCVESSVFALSGRLDVFPCFGSSEARCRADDAGCGCDRGAAA